MVVRRGVQINAIWIVLPTNNGISGAWVCLGMDIMSRIVHTLFPLRSNVKKDINKKQTYDVLYTCCQVQYPLLVFYIRQTSVENDYPIRRGRILFYCDILYT